MEKLRNDWEDEVGRHCVVMELVGLILLVISVANLFSAPPSAIINLVSGGVGVVVGIAAIMGGCNRDKSLLTVVAVGTIIYLILVIVTFVIIASIRTLTALDYILIGINFVMLPYLSYRAILLRKMISDQDVEKARA